MEPRERCHQVKDRCFHLVALGTLLCFPLGCSSEQQAGDSVPSNPPQRAGKSVSPAKRPTRQPPQQATLAPNPPGTPTPGESHQTGGRTLAPLVVEAIPARQEPRPLPDEAQLAAAGLRQFSGKHLTLITDLPEEEEFNKLVALFDAAVPQWGEYFGIEAADYQEWRVVGFLIGDEIPFRRLRLLPLDREVGMGFALANRLWLREQPSTYYRRHLLLHEGTHAFMHAQLQAFEPGWIMEGLAELLGTHQFGTDRLQLGIFPNDSRQVRLLGRIELIQEAVRNDQILPLERVMQIDNRRPLEVELYAWCWAAAQFLDAHPAYQERFRQLAHTVQEPDFNARFRNAFRSDWPQLEAEWLHFAANLAYGYDIAGTAIPFPDTAPRGTVFPAQIKVAAAQGWQPARVWLNAGTPYTIAARGRYQVDNDPQPWWCEPPGVTVRYLRDEPLGKLLAALWYVDPQVPAAAPVTAFADPLAIGAGVTVTPERSGWLYFKINDSPAELGNNSGSLSVTVTSP